MEYQARRSTTTQLPFQQLLESNNLGIIENPLRRIHEDDLDADIRNFHQEEGLAEFVDVDDLVRAGRLARDEEATVIEGRLTTVELTALQREKISKIWTESKELKIILLTCKQSSPNEIHYKQKGIDSNPPQGCVASVVQGWAQGAIVGANRGW